MAGRGWATLTVGSQLGSQLGYLGHQQARQNGPVGGGLRGDSGGVGGRARIAVAESRTAFALR